MIVSAESWELEWIELTSKEPMKASGSSASSGPSGPSGPSAFAQQQQGLAAVPLAQLVQQLLKNLSQQSLQQLELLEAAHDSSSSSSSSADDSGSVNDSGLHLLLQFQRLLLVRLYSAHEDLTSPVVITFNSIKSNFKDF